MKLERMEKCKSEVAVPNEDVGDSCSSTYEGETLKYRLRQASMGSLNLDSFLSYKLFLSQLSRTKRNANVAILYVREEIAGMIHELKIPIDLVTETLRFVSYFLQVTKG